MFYRIQLETKHINSFIFLIYAFVIILGMCLGSSIGSRPDGLFYMLASTLPGEEPIAVFRFIILFLPLCLTVWIVAAGKIHFLLLLLFLKTVLFSMTASGICSAFSYAGWLLGFLMLFPEIIGFAVYHWLWLRCLGCTRGSTRDFLVCGVSLLAVYLLDFMFISPFTALLFEDL